MADFKLFSISSLKNPSAKLISTIGEFSEIPIAFNPFRTFFRVSSTCFRFARSILFTTITTFSGQNSEASSRCSAVCGWIPAIASIIYKRFQISIGAHLQLPTTIAISKTVEAASTARIKPECPGQSTRANLLPEHVIVENPKSSVFRLTSSEACASNADVEPMSAIRRVSVVLPESTCPRIPTLREALEVEGSEVI